MQQIILSICNVSIAVNNKISECTNSFNGETSFIRPHISVTVAGNARSWLFDTGAVSTCMPTRIFKDIFRNKSLPQQVHNTLKLKSASGDALKQYGTFLLQMTIRGKIYSHPVIILDNLNECILGIDFMHKHNISYDASKRQILLDQQFVQTIHATKQIVVPALSSKIIKTRFAGTPLPDANFVATIAAPQHNTISGMPQLVSINNDKICSIVIDNCAPYDVTIDRDAILGVVETETDVPTPLDDNFINSLISKLDKKHSKKTLQRTDIESRANLNVPEEYKCKYISLLHKYQDAISTNKYDLGLAKDFKHKIHLKDENPVYRKQFKIPDAHRGFIEQTLDEWLRLGVVRRSNSLYNSPIFCVPKKQGQGLRIVQDFRELNNHTHIDKYSMKEIHECIGDIGRANSTIFSTLDLTSGFWQMPLDEKAKHLTAFTIPGKGQFEWVTSPMGLLGCPASFQRLMEQVLRPVDNVIVYIDDVLVHTDNHDKHLQTLEKVLQCLQSHKLKINLDKCIFGNTKVDYLGFVLTPDGIKPGTNKLKAIQDAKPPTDVKMIRSFIGLCNFFRTHIKDFARVAAPLYKLTRKDSDDKGGTLPKEAMDAYEILRKQLISEPVMAYPRSDRQYALITDASTGSSTIEGGLGAILTQADDKGRHHAIAYASRQLKDHEKNYSPFLLEAAAAVWGMDTFNEYLKGKRFILYTDHKPLEKMGHLHTKTMNRLQTAMNEYDCIIQYKKGDTMPADFLSRQIDEIVENNVDAFDPFQPDLRDLQKKDEELQAINTYRTTGKWPTNISQNTIRALAMIEPKLYQDKNKLVWCRLEDNNYPRNALWLPHKYRKQAICEAHNEMFGGHNAALKTFLKISSSYAWPRMYTEILNHTKTCLQCQQRKPKLDKRPPLQPLPIPDTPNMRIHADLFGPMTGSDRKSKFVLCMTDAFTKYAIVTTIPNKEAETVSQAIFEHWFCKFGLPAQIHTDGGKEFCNKLADHLYLHLNIKHTTTSPAHPQCNAQVEQFNKTVKKYLESYVQPHTLDWEQFIPALNLSYNTSYHSTIATTPFELLFGVKPRLPSFPNPDIERVHYGEDFASERLNILRKARLLAHQHAQRTGQMTKDNFDKNTKAHSLKIGDSVLIKEMNFQGKNAKLAPKWIGPAKIIDVNETNARIKTAKGKEKVINVERLKLFNSSDTSTDQNDASHPDIDLKIRTDPDRRLTRAMAKLIKLQDAAELALNLIKAVQTECDEEDAEDDATKDFNQFSINAIDERHREALLKIAHHLLISDKDNFNELTPQDQALWNSFPTVDIYEFLTGQKDEFPEFKANWTTPSDSITFFVPAQAQQPVTHQAAQPTAQPQQAIPVPNIQPGPSTSTASATNLRPRKEVDYKQLHTGKIFKSMKQRTAARCNKGLAKVTQLLSPSSLSSKKAPK